MCATMLQYQATEKGGPFSLTTVSKPTPEPNDVCIRIKAVALNPLDWSMLTYGAMVQEWPATFGLDGAGVVEAVGSEVTAFQPGDEVFSLCGIGGKTAGFQEIVTVPQHFVSKQPSNVSFEEAVSLPICYLTAASAIINGLGVPVPHISSTAPGEPHSEPRSVLVLGGSSAVGGAAIQMLRSALPDAVILTTASVKHANRLQGLGATATIDRSSATLVADVKAHTPEGVDAIVDCVTAAAGNSRVFDALRGDGPRLYSQVFTNISVTPPENVKATVVFGRQIFGAPGGLGAMAALGKLVGEGKYKLPVPIEIVGKGWESVGTGLQRYAKGISGQKLVVSI